jgi:hypothetical protein
MSLLETPAGSHGDRTGGYRPTQLACQWAFASLTPSPGARAFYDQRRAGGDTHNRALRALANRLVGILHGCLRYGVIYDEDTAWAHRIERAA